MKTFLKGIGVLAALIFVGSFFIPELKFSFSEQQAQETIQKSIPLTRTDLGVTNTINTLTVDFTGDNTVKGIVSVTSGILGREVDFRSEFESGIHYDNGSIYLVEPSFNEFVVTDKRFPKTDIGLLEKGKSLFKKKESSINNLLGKFEATKKLSKENQEQQLKHFKEAAISFAKTNIENKPIYTLGGDKYQEAAKMALTGVSFNEHSVDITLSISQFLTKLVLMIIAFCMAVLASVGYALAIFTGRASAPTPGISDLVG